MTGEIDKDFYCSADGLNAYYECRNDNLNRLCGVVKDCPNRHRKHPTPEQFKEEYGQDYPDNGAVWFREEKCTNLPEWSEWSLQEYLDALENGKIVDEYGRIYQIICACTPFSCPPKNWMPKE